MFGVLGFREICNECETYYDFMKIMKLLVIIKLKTHRIDDTIVS